MKANPSFDPRNYGFQKLGELVRAQPYLEVKSIPVGDGELWDKIRRLERATLKPRGR